MCSIASAKFQSTLPVRGATCRQGRQKAHSVVSIHAPGEGSDLIADRVVIYRLLFQSTLPVRGATCAR